MATKKKKTSITVEKTVMEAEVVKSSAPNEHTHQYVLGGAVRDGEFIEFCTVCADQRTVSK